MIQLLSAFQDALAALYASMHSILVLWVIVICIGIILFLWNSNSRLREGNYELRRRTITAEAAVAFANTLTSPDAKANFLWECQFGGGRDALYSGWPAFLHARLAAALDNRS
ncbi:hypothetical protein [Agrobacterium vitis]|uniref:hypothetical protein n=1 Tax=Agrobacterium vitis TaxID=373 RepID=UPI001F2D3433|nr:hypothetical protein [Agrobacterium vitis]MCF1453435.1 hypothetical protein [Agrobacterium vitis]